MVLLESLLLGIGLAAAISSIDFIAKTTSNITHSLGIPEYLASTIILSFVISIPVMLILFFSNIYEATVFGFSTIVGFAITTMTLIFGVFLISNEVPIVYEGHRNATFMWAACLLFFVTSLDRFIDRMDAVFLLSLFVFYALYMYYRTSKSKNYVFLRRRSTHLLLYPLAFFAIIFSCLLVYGMSVNLCRLTHLNQALMGLVFIGPILAIPLFDIIRNVFTSSILTFDNLIGNVTISLTLVPGLIALTQTLPLISNGAVDIFPLLLLNVICLSFALLTRMTRSIHRRTGIVLIACFVGYILYSLLTVI